jgi:hypothetical protein
MIKSKFSFIGIFCLWYLSLTGLFFSYLTFGIFLHFFEIELVKNNLTNTESIIFLFVNPLIISIAFAQVKINSNIIYIDILNKTIFFRNYFTRQKKIYSFSEFEGYIDTFMKSPRGDFRVFYLVRESKPSNKMSGRFYSNIEEIEQALKHMKYLGFHKFSLKWSLRIFFHKKVLE